MRKVFNVYLLWQCLSAQRCPCVVDRMLKSSYFPLLFSLPPPPPPPPLPNQAGFVHVCDRPWACWQLLLVVDAPQKPSLLIKCRSVLLFVPFVILCFLFSASNHTYYTLALLCDLNVPEEKICHMHHNNVACRSCAVLWKKICHLYHNTVACRSCAVLF